MSARRLSSWMVAVLCAVACGLVPVGVANAAGLPDGRVYEQVSSLTQYSSDVYVPRLTTPTAIATDLPFQASADGERVAFIGGLSEGGNELSGLEYGNQYLGSRLPGGGWAQSNIAPAGFTQSLFEAFSSDLSTGIVESVEPLSSTAPGFGESPTGRFGNYDILYSTNTAGNQYVPFFTTKPPYRSMEGFQTAQPYAGFDKANNRTLGFAGASSDFTHLLFSANDALTGASEGRPAADGGPGSPFENENNLYESANGQLRLVNVLPDGSTHANATFGGGTPFSHVISSDGSRIFWTDLTTGHIYVRENDTTTVEISSAGQYQSSSSDGSVVFYTNGDLYEYELETGHTTDLTPGVPVEKVVGSSEDGKYVYYVTTGGELELWHGGQITAIAATRVTQGEVTPDGHSIVFTFEPYDHAQEKIMIYNADTHVVYCPSCSTGGTEGLLPVTNTEPVYQPRWISADGNRVFFDSYTGLLPQDANGKLDVYEWQRPGTGECPTGGSEGCLYLLSGGSSTDESQLADASESGNDVFIITRAKLTASDEGEAYDLYDVRVDGYSPPAPQACTGSGCQGVPGAQPVFATPSSVTFGGVGNFAPPAQEAKAKPKPKKKQHKKKQKQQHKKSKSKAKKSARRADARKRSGAKGGLS